HCSVSLLILPRPDWFVHENVKGFPREFIETPMKKEGYEMQETAITPQRWNPKLGRPMMGTEMLGTMGLPVKKLANAAAVKKSDLSNLTQN
ncbi:unnamed protein product, partial [Durusdinium trenchii]